MKKIIKYMSIALTLPLVGVMSSCNDFLDTEPGSFVTPENYLKDVSHLSSYTVGFYELIDSHSTSPLHGFAINSSNDNDDNQQIDYNDKFVKGEYRVPSEKGEWNFEEIYDLNYFLDVVEPRFANGEISGSEEMIKHHIGEAYFFRAFVYYHKLTTVGDFPIVTEPLIDEKESLIEASKRDSRDKVARFILSDLDKAIDLLAEEAPDGKRNLLSKDVAYLMKSRVALYEASWLKNFKGTAFVPGGVDWPGASMDYNADFAYESGSIDNEIKYLYKVAMDAAKEVAEGTELTVNNKVIPSEDHAENPYCGMYSDVDLSGYPEVLLWRDYNQAFDISHTAPRDAAAWTSSLGMTHELVMSFLDESGKPMYAANNPNFDENDLYKLKAGRDWRVQLFLAHPYQSSFYINYDATNTGADHIQLSPIMNSTCATGYISRKYISMDRLQHSRTADTGCPSFRVAEAYLNYIEASYYYNGGSIDVTADKYWRALRTRAGINPDYNVTIAALDMQKEADIDWGAYSAGQLISTTEMAIRKERRSEYMFEGRRSEDLKRWRSFDQLVKNPHRLRGVVAWEGANKGYFETTIYESNGELYIDNFIYGKDDVNSIVSDPALGKYFYPHSIIDGPSYNGCTWQMAHYLTPIATTHFYNSSVGNDISTSVIYQNPYWTMTSGVALQ